MSLRVHQELSIIGVNDTPMAAWAMIDLTTIRQPLAEIGSLEARRIAERVPGAQNKAPPHHITPTRLIRRKTTCPAP
jgi:LacI family transcriptional regulator